MINSFAALSPEGEGFFIFLALPLRRFEFCEEVIFRSFATLRMTKEKKFFQIVYCTWDGKGEKVFSDSLLRSGRQRRRSD